MTAHVDPEVVRPTDVPPQPWANGLGVTRVLLARPDRRISVAEIEGTTRFSAFPGMDRMLIPLTPSGLTLDVGVRRRRLRSGQPALFRGEDEATGHAGMRRVTVVNVMTRRSHLRLHSRIVRGDDVLHSESGDVIVVLGGLVAVDTEPLPAGTVLIPARAGGVPAFTARRGAVAVLRWVPASAPQETGR